MKSPTTSRLLSEDESMFNKIFGEIDSEGKGAMVFSIIFGIVIIVVAVCMTITELNKSKDPRYFCVSDSVARNSNFCQRLLEIK